ncbi:hypothetical protein ACHAWF_009506, partial [Thalassiosira exigua]
MATAALSVAHVSCPCAGRNMHKHLIPYSASNDNFFVFQLLDYGEQWHHRNYKRHVFLDKVERKAKADGGGLRREKKGFVEGIGRRWDVLDHTEYDRCPRETPTEEAKRTPADFKPFDLDKYRTNNLHPLDDASKAKVWERDEDEEDESDDEGTARSLPWLKANGICLSSGHLGKGLSFKVQAGRGIFATTTIGAGKTIITTPLLAMRRDDFNIYKADETQKAETKVLDKDNIIATELLLNYAYSHPDSPLYLVPTAPLASFVNHGGPAEANVEIRWPALGSNAARLFQWTYNQDNGHPKDDFKARGPSMTSDDFLGDPTPWLKDHPIDVMERSGRLGWEYVALRDIRPLEEILIDYGRRAGGKHNLGGLLDAGFYVALNAVGTRFGYTNLTCWHASYMGMTHCDKSVMHTDIFATDDKSWNLVFPLVTVEGTEPELDVVAEDLNTVVGVNYLKDVVFAVGEWGYHKTRTVSYRDGEGAGGAPIRIVFGAYCSQIDETNVAMTTSLSGGGPGAVRGSVLGHGECGGSLEERRCKGERRDDVIFRWGGGWERSGRMTTFRTE